MSKSLIVYFSHNKENYVSGNIVNLEKGNVKVICETLETLIDADVYEIKELKAYPTNYRECTKVAQDELRSNARPAILDPIKSIDDYDTLYLAYPNWWSTMPMIVKTFLESYDFSGKEIYPICSHEGSGMGQSESDLKKLCPHSVIHKGLSIHGSHVDQCKEQLERWLGGK